MVCAAIARERFAGYLLQGRLGGGSMAEVWLAQRGRESQVVLKRLPPAFARDELRRALFEGEIWLTRQLHHPNIVRVLDSGEEANLPYLVLERVSGVDLASVLARAREQGRRLPGEMAVQVGVCLAGALGAVHALTDESGRSLLAVHRDVSPSNLLAQPDGVVRLCDFGLVRARGLPDPVVPGTLVGQAAYVAPEVLGGAGYDHRADLFSLGVVLHELLAGRRLFWRGSEAATLLAVADAPIPPLAESRDDLSAALVDLVSRLLSRQVETRPSGAAAVEAELSTLGASPVHLGNLVHSLFG